MTPKQIESIVSTPLLKFFLTSSMEKVLYTISDFKTGSGFEKASSGFDFQKSG